MSAEDVGSGFTTAGKLVASISPMLAAIPVAGPILSVIGELLGEGLSIAGSGITLSAQQTAEIVAAVRVAIEVARAARAATGEAHDARTAATQRIIDEAKATAASAITGEPVVK